MVHDIHPEFKKLFVPNKIDLVLCTGNLCAQHVYDMFRGFCSHVKAVRGEFDDIDLPERDIVEVDGVRIGLINGYQLTLPGEPDTSPVSSARQASISRLLCTMDADILVTGDMPKLTVTDIDGHIVISPGSATGISSRSSGTEENPDEVEPSFVVLKMGKGSLGTLFFYTIVDDKLKVRKKQIRITRKQ